MQEISKFIVDNWQWLLTAILSIFVLIIQLLKKKPVVKSLKGYLDFIASDLLPRMINKAEVSGLHGEGKKAYVMKEAIGTLKFLIQCDEHALEEANRYFDNAIEAILSTPRKKD